MIGKKDGESTLKKIAKLFKKKTYQECCEKFQMMFGKKEIRKSTKLAKGKVMTAEDRFREAIEN